MVSIAITDWPDGYNLEKFCTEFQNKGYKELDVFYRSDFHSNTEFDTAMLTYKMILTPLKKPRLLYRLFGQTYQKHLGGTYSAPGSRSYEDTRLLDKGCREDFKNKVKYLESKGFEVNIRNEKSSFVESTI